MRSDTEAPVEYQLLDSRVHALTVDHLQRLVAAAIREGTRRVFASQNLHSLRLQASDARLRAFYEGADYVRIDGMSVVLLGRLLGLPLRRAHRVTYLDWLPAFMGAAARAGWRVFHLGSRPGVGERAAVALRARHPGLQLATAHGYFDVRRDGPDNREVIAAINRFRPDVLMVGMGMPRQQLWVLENRDSVDAKVISTSGAILDYIAGEIPTPPRWVGPLGLEWLVRLAAEPRRLGGRYLVDPWFMLPSVARHLIRTRLG